MIEKKNNVYIKKQSWQVSIKKKIQFTFTREYLFNIG